MKKIIVLFKTHLDVGFTDLSANVVEKYNKIYIPQAIRVAEELEALGCREGFTWTTGSWLIDQYRRQASAEELAVFDRAVMKKQIRWHGLPTTMHSEAADRELFRYGLSISKKLDEHFGVTTVGGKFTDVPGHTRAIVPLMAEAGVEMLHIGVNPASTAPDVPMYFRWLDVQSGCEITVMYNKGDYGEFSHLPGTETAVYFAHTGDNCGPSSSEHILSVYRKLHEDYPDAEVTAGDLSDLAIALRESKPYLPVITSELGDTWIHGAGTDPKKLSRFRAMLRLAREASEEEREILYRSLIMVPEHTWGLDEKTWLNDTKNFSREDFMTAKNASDELGDKYRHMEESWAEQRAYVTRAAEALPDGETKKKAEKLLAEYRCDRPDFEKLDKLEGNCASVGEWEIAWNDAGVLVSIVKNGTVYADEAHHAAEFLYQAFTEEEVEDFKDRYLKPHMRNIYWAVHDFGKVGCAYATDGHCDAASVLRGAYRDGEKVVFDLTVKGDASEKYGCAAEMSLTLSSCSEGLLFDFAWYDKPAFRNPEALWLGFSFTEPLTAVQKLGSDIHPLDVVSLGNRELHASDGKLTFGRFTLENVDSPLISVGKPCVYSFRNEIPDTSRGIYANLFNNQWGTNFPMWCEGDARFRFVLR